LSPRGEPPLRLDEPLERLREPVDRFVPLDLLLVPEDDERDRVDPDRERKPELPPLPGCFWLPLSSSPLPSSFFPTATAAGTATPSAAPAATFFLVDMPSFPSMSAISTSSS
jgi:hypothetical protein